MLRMQREVQVAWSRWFPNKEATIRRDLLMAVEIFTGSEHIADEVVFAMLVGCSSRSGRIEPRQQFAMARLVPSA